MRELDGLINLDQMTVNGKTHRQNVERVVEHNPEVIRPVSDAYSDHGSITVLKGNLAPDGCSDQAVGPWRPAMRQAQRSCPLL